MPSRVALIGGMVINPLNSVWLVAVDLKCIAIFLEIVKDSIISVVIKETRSMGRAQCEAAQSRKSEWTVDLGIRNYSRNSATRRMTPKTCNLEPRGKWNCVSLHLGSVNICAHSFFCLWTKVHHFTWKTLVRIFPLAPKLSRLTCWILSQIFNFRDWFFLSGPPSQLGCALGSLCQSLTRLKISGRTTS